MRYSTRVKPISYLKANAAEVLAELAELREPLLITRHGEAKAVVQDITSYEQTQETLALLKTLALGQRDVESLHDDLVEHDSIAAARHRLDEIARVIETLALFPDRGAHPPELLALGIREFRQTGFKPYRVIYRVGSDQVVIHLIVDGRRDLPSLLGRRLLGV